MLPDNKKERTDSIYDPLHCQKSLRQKNAYKYYPVKFYENTCSLFPVRRAQYSSYRENECLKKLKKEHKLPTQTADLNYKQDVFLERLISTGGRMRDKSKIGFTRGSEFTPYGKNELNGYSEERFETMVRHHRRQMSGTRKEHIREMDINDLRAYMSENNY